jgi:hypothetical protein
LTNSGESKTGLFSRQAAAFGEKGEERLRGVRAGVVGAGGTGSAVAEQLLRLGVGEILVIDDDEVSASSVTRQHESGATDVGVAKVSQLHRAAKRIGLGSMLVPVRGRITDLAVAQLLRNCDVIFGCTDDNAGRIILSRVAYWYLVPVIDVGVRIEAQGDRLDIFARVSVCEPGKTCLVCRDRIDLEAARAELLPPAERDHLVASGYLPNQPAPAPSVVTFTTMVATFAVNEFLGSLFRYAPSDWSGEMLIRPGLREINRLERAPVPGHYCIDETSWGAGDGNPFLGRLWGGEVP